MTYGEARLQALKFGWESYLDEAGKSEDNELTTWIVKTWKTLRKAGLALAEKDLPGWLQTRLRAGREQTLADAERAEFKKSPAEQVEMEREKRAKWEKARAECMKREFGEPGYPEKYLADIAQSLRDISYFCMFKAPRRPLKPGFGDQQQKGGRNEQH